MTRPPLGLYDLPDQIMFVAGEIDGQRSVFLGQAEAAERHHLIEGSPLLIGQLGEIGGKRRRQHAAAGDRVDVDVGPGHVQRTGLRERHDGGLGCAIARTVGARGGNAGHRPDVDDLAGALRLHQPQRLPRAEEHAMDVDAPEAQPVLIGQAAEDA